MFVRFIKDCKRFKKDTIIKCSALNGNLLVKKGYAVQEQRCYKAKDLCVAEIVKVDQAIKGIGVTNYTSVEYRIFLHKNNGKILSEFNGYDDYTHVITGEKYHSSKHPDCQAFPKGLEVVRKESVMQYNSFFYADMRAKGLTSDSYISSRDIAHNEYVVNVRIKNSKQLNNRDIDIDYCH